MKSNKDAMRTFRRYKRRGLIKKIKTV